MFPDNIYSYFLTKDKILNYKSFGKAIIGTLCDSVPEEVIHSTGAVPLRMLGLSKTTENADVKMPSWLCYYSRRILEDGLRGHFRYVDGVIGACSDDTKMRLYSLYKFHVKPTFSHILQLPLDEDEKSILFFRDELAILARKLASFLRSDWSMDKLEGSLKIYNRFRSLCQELNELRVGDSPKISGVDYMKTILGSTSMLKEDFNVNVQKLLENLKDAEGIKDYKLRVHVSGPEFYDVELLELIESLGAVIVSDDLSTSYVKGHIDEHGDLLRNVAKHYLNCPSLAFFRIGAKDKIQLIKDEVERSRAEALIILRDKGCENYGWLCPLITEEFGDFPVLVLDIDTPIFPEQYKTRIEAFIETLSD